MSILSKYLYKEFSKLIAICLLVFVSIYLIIQFFGRIDDFLEAGVSRNVIVSYFLFKIPYIIVQMVPPASLIAVIILFGVMKKNNEITALKASGIDILGLVQPLIIFALFLSLSIFLVSEVVVPYTSTKANSIWRVQVRKKDPRRFYGRNHIWYKGKNRIYWIKYFDPSTGLMRDISLYFFTPDFRLRKRIDAKYAFFKEGKWILKDGILLKLAKNKGWQTHTFQVMTLELPENIQTFSHENRKPEELNYWELKRFANRVKSEGYDANRYFVDLNIKISFPFIIVIMTLMGIPISLKVEKGGIPVAVSMGIGVSFIYLLILGLCRAIGFSGVLPPFVAAWFANALFSLLGIYLLMRVPR